MEVEDSFPCSHESQLALLKENTIENETHKHKGKEEDQRGIGREQYER
jgi:hypothetical protein